MLPRLFGLNESQERTIRPSTKVELEKWNLMEVRAGEHKPIRSRKRRNPIPEAEAQE